MSTTTETVAKPDKVAYDAEQETLKKQIDTLQTQLVRLQYVHTHYSLLSVKR